MRLFSEGLESGLLVIGLLIICSFFLWFYLIDNLSLMAFGVYTALAYNVVYAFSSFKKRFGFLAFNFMFFTFLVSQILLNDFLSISLDMEVFLFSGFSKTTQKHIFTLLFVSLVSVFLGYKYNESKLEYKRYKPVNLYSDYTLVLRRFSKQLMWFFVIFAILENVEKALFVQSVGYLEYYTDFESRLPFFVPKLARYYELSVFLYLATIPQKKEAITPIILFVLVGCLSLGYGQRNGLMFNILFVVVYFMFRDYQKFYGPHDIWMTKGLRNMLLISVPFLLVFMVVFASSRVNEKVDSNLSFTDLILGFFYIQGTSYRIIGYEFEFANQFPSSFPYSLGYFVDLYQQNYLFRLLGVYPEYAPHSIDAAVHGHTFGDVITYLYSPDFFLKGSGLGSCYIAEIYHDFRIFGLVLLNFLYGYIIALLSRRGVKNVWTLYILFCLLPNIFYAPRAPALNFLSEIVKISFVLYYFVVKMYVKSQLKNNVAGVRKK